MKYNRPAIFFLPFVLLVLLSSCTFSFSKELEVEIHDDSLTYYYNEAFSKDIFTVKDRDSGEEIDDFYIYLDDEILIDDGYIFDKRGSYEVSIKADGYEDYVISDYKLLVVNNELTADSTLMKTSYFVGQSLTYEGLVVYDVFGNEVSDYTTDLTEGHVFTTKGTFKVNVRKDNYLSDQINITVTDSVYIELDTTNVTKIYEIGEEFSLEGLVVTLSSTGEEIDNYESSIEEGTILDEEGTYTVTISYLDYVSASFDIEVTSENIMEISNYPKQDYIVGEYFDISELEVRDRTSKEILNNNLLSFYIDEKEIDENHIFEEEGNFEVNIEADGYISTSYQIEVDGKGLYIQSLPDKTEYIVGDELDLSGLVVTDRVNEITDYEISLEEGHVFLHKGTITIKLTKDGYSSTSFDVEVSNQKGMFVKSKPTKQYYEVGDTFDSTGLVIEDNNTYEEITNYSLSIDDGYEFTSAGDYEITISSEGYPDITFEIGVIDKLEVGDSRTINIYTLNDTHGKFLRDIRESQAGIAYIGNYFKNKDDENAVIVSVGDMWQGGLQSNDTDGIIMTEAMNMIGFDAMALGNHEFDWGEEAIYENLDIATFPFLSCNTFKADTEEIVDFASGSTIIDLAGLKVGIIGAARENMGSSILTSIASNYDFPKANEYIKDESDKLREEGCDIVILADHDEGMDGYDENPTDFYDLTEISDVSNERYVDTMLFGHDHYRKNGDMNKVSYVEAGRYGEYFGNVTITLTKQSDGSYEIDSNTARYENAVSTCTTEDEEIANLVDIYSDVIRDGDEVIYTFKNSYSSEDFGVIVCQAIVWFMEKYNNEFGNHTIYAGTHNSAGIRNSVSEGDFTYQDLIDVCPFDNCLALQKCTSLSQANNQTSRYLSYINPNGGQDEDGYYYIGTISYVAEYNTSIEYTEYEAFVIQDVVYEFLTNTDLEF